MLRRPQSPSQPLTTARWAFDLTGQAQSNAEPQPPTETLLTLADLLLKQIDMQQQVRDRWFNYFALITAGIGAFATAAFKLFDNDDVGAVDLLIAGLLLLASALATCFFALYLRQRRNYAAHYRLLEALQRTIVEDSLQVTYSSFYPASTPFVPQPRGADYFTLLIEALISSAYSAAFVGTLLAACGSRTVWIIAVSVTAAFFANLAGLNYIKISFERRTAA